MRSGTSKPRASGRAGERASEVVVDNLDDLSHPRRDDVTPAMLEQAATAVRDVGARLRANRYRREPAGNDETARDRTCARCDLVGICGGHRAATRSVGDQLP